MCIKHTVGAGGQNQRLDVMVVQVLLNENIGRLIPFAPLMVDGRCGPGTITVIQEFQRRVMGLKEHVGLVGPGSATFRTLCRGAVPRLDPDKLRVIMGGAAKNLIDLYYDALATGMSQNGMTTPLRMAHFLAQIGHESGDLIYAEEIADGSKYEGRKDLGNTEPGDGKKFKGRGLIQLTGRANYTAYGKARNQDFVTPENYLTIATDSHLAVDVSGWFWTTHQLNQWADKDNLLKITKVINGGTNGLADRTLHLARAKTMLGIS